MTQRQVDDTPARLSLLGPGTASGQASASALGRFVFSEQASGWRDLGSDLCWLGGDVTDEIWWAQPPVTDQANASGFATIGGADVAFVSRRLPDPGDNELAEATREAYATLIAEAQCRGYPWVLRTWHFVPAINRGSGDEERYRRFCVGRERALVEAGFGAQDLGAATAVGSHGRDLVIHMLVGAEPGVAVENPRQRSAYRYPRNYGPSRPAFVRALGVPLADGDYGLMISGTASIVGYETRHPGDVMPQLEETVNNLQALLQQAAEVFQRPPLGVLNGNSFFRVYVRHAGDWPAVAERLRHIWPDARMTGLEADICRRDLSLEIEAFHRG
jgi:chorismate lyase/3-hydroxybenzoate synthase